jgi:hypothetical protein
MQPDALAVDGVCPLAAVRSAVALAAAVSVGMDKAFCISTGVAGRNLIARANDRTQGDFQKKDYPTN